MTNTERAAKRAANKVQAERIAQAKADVVAVLRSGHCPRCGSGIRQNLSITGWWQCEQYGAETHRKDPSKPSCEWQGFE